MSILRIKQGARIRDVAEAAGVSKTTVSLVVNGRAEQVGVCLATRQRVEAMIRQMGYVPSAAALEMATGRVPVATATAIAPTAAPITTPCPAAEPSIEPIPVPREPESPPAVAPEPQVPPEPEPAITTPPAPEPTPEPAPVIQEPDPPVVVPVIAEPPPLNQV